MGPAFIPADNISKTSALRASILLSMMLEIRGDSFSYYSKRLSSSKAWA